MADPLSIIAGTVGLADVCFRFIQALKKAQHAAGGVEKDINGLLTDVRLLSSTNKAVEDAWAARQDDFVPSSPVAWESLEKNWQNVSYILKECRTVVEELDTLVQSVIGEGEPRVRGRIDGIRKSLRKQSKEPEFNQLRHRLANYQENLQLLLSTISITMSRANAATSEAGFEKLGEDMYNLGQRVKEHISSLKHSTDSDASKCISYAADAASALVLNRHFYIAQSVSSNFTGRQSLLLDLYQALNMRSTAIHGQIQKRFVIYGLGGSGKTQFCCKFAQEYRESYWAVFYIDASSKESAKNTFTQIAKIGGVEPNNRAARHWLSSLTLPWLLLIDNADDPLTPLEDYFPEGERGVVLVTTRDPAKKVHGTVGSRFYHFTELETDAANELLLRSSGEKSPWSISSLSAAAEIAKTLGYLPLALIHAGQAIVDGLCSLANYLNFYHKNWRRIRQTRRPSQDYSDTGLNMKVFSTYEIIYQGLEAADSEETRNSIELLQLFCFLHHKNVDFNFLIKAATNPPREEEHAARQEAAKKAQAAFAKPKTWRVVIKERLQLLAGTIFHVEGPPVLPAALRIDHFDEIRLRLALRELTQRSLIDHNVELDTYSMHPLVHTWTRERQKVGEQAIWCQAAATTVTQAILLPPLGTNEEDESLQMSLLSHVTHILTCQQEIEAKIKESQKSRRTSWLLPKPQMTRQKAMQHTKFSLVHLRHGMWKEAEELQLGVRNFICQYLSLDHPAAMGITLLLSQNLSEQTRENESAGLRREVLGACMENLGASHPTTLKAMDILASSCARQGRFKEALQLHEDTVTGMTRTLGPDHEDTLMARDNLGWILAKYFRHEEAAEQHHIAFKGLHRILGPTHQSTLTAKENIAMAYMNIGGDLLEEAHSLITDVLEQRRLKLKEQHPFTLLATSNLARIKSAMGDHREAERLMRQLWPIAERNLGENHYGLLAGKAELGLILARQERYEEAEELLRDVTERQKYSRSARSSDAGDHPDRIHALWCLVQCLQFASKYHEALEVCDELQRVIERIGGEGLGLQHPFAERLAQKRVELLVGT